MKLLFDANLSPKLVNRLAELFPESTRVFSTGLANFTPDERIWAHAGANGFTIVTADADFLRLAETSGPPPRVIRMENCNYKTSVVEELLPHNAVRITDLEQSSRHTLIIRNPL